MVHNPVLILNIYEETLTLTGDFGGELGGDFDWFVAGINGAWVTNPKEPIGYIMQKTDRKGVFTCEINVTQSEGEFKICTTDWTEEWGTKDPYYVEITNDNLTVELEQIFEVKKGNVPYSLTPGNYRFTWNYNTKIITVAACPDYYVVGANVNGNEDWLGTDRGKFEKKGNGIYEWRGTELGTSFKINAGNGDWETVNIGSNGSPIEKGVPYEYETGSSTLNIELHSGSIVINPVILLNVNDCTLTLTGDFGGEFNWFVAGINDVWVTNPNNSGYLLEQTDEEGVFACEINVVQAEGEFKISKTNWTERWGTNNPDVIELTNENLEVELEELYGEEGNLSYVLTPGNYKFTWDYNTKTLVVTDSSSVISIEEGESEAVYYTLQGVRVANPVKGVYIKVAGNKTDKIVR